MGRSRPTGPLAAAGDARACARTPASAPEQLDAAEREGIRSGQPLGPDPLDRLRLGWLKTFADGSLGSRTAALLEPLESAARASRSRPTAATASGSRRPRSSGPRPRGPRRSGSRPRSTGSATRRCVPRSTPSRRPSGRRRSSRASSTRSSSTPTTSRASRRSGSRPRSSRSTSGATRRRPGGCGATRAELGGLRARRDREDRRAHPHRHRAPVEPVDPWPGVAAR